MVNSEFGCTLSFQIILIVCKISWRCYWGPTSGIPKGTVLLSLLFMILISDIDADVGSDIIFADDTQIYLGINEISRSENLQSDLDTIYIWAEQNNMQFN